MNLNYEKFKNLINFLIGIGISIIIFYFIFSGIDFNKVLLNLKNMKLYFLIFYVLNFFLINFLKSCRVIFFIENKKFNFRDIFNILKIIFIGTLLNNFMPLRSGDIIRSLIISEKFFIKDTFMIGTIIVERLFDFLIFFMFFSLFLIITRLDVSLFLKHLSGIGLIIVCFLFFVFIYFRKYKAFVFRKLNNLYNVRFLKRFNIFLNAILNGFSVLGNSNNTLVVALFSILIWIFEAFGFFIIGKSFSINIPFFGFLFIMIITYLGTIIPSGPFFFGLYESMISFSMSFYLDNDERIMAFALFFHILQILFIFIFGSFFMIREKINFFVFIKQLKNRIKFFKF